MYTHDHWLVVSLQKGLVTGKTFPDSKVHGANMGPTWGRQDPGGPHVGPMNLVIWVMLCACSLTLPLPSSQLLRPRSDTGSPSDKTEGDPPTQNRGLGDPPDARRRATFCWDRWGTRVLIDKITCHVLLSYSTNSTTKTFHWHACSFGI